MMFRPREGHDLRLLQTKLEITPAPASLRWLHDVFDNSVAVATFDGCTSQLRFDSTVTLEQVETTPPEYPIEESAKTYPFRYSEDELPNLGRALLHHYPSDDVRRWALQFLDTSGTTGTMSLLRSMTLGVKKDFLYTRRSEKGIQSPSETLESRRGSCRDFAVLMMEAARSLGLAARFVSGYIFVPHMDAVHTVGGGATHAWMQAYLPGAGWVDFDPTNSIIGNRNLIRVAVAWDPKQVLPLWGTFVGRASSFLGMDVTVSVTEDRPQE
jgi:transglutaminase-like putative cysteine protease